MRTIVAATSLSAASAHLLRVGINHTLAHDGHHGGIMGEKKTAYGMGECQCIGIDNLEGVTETTAGNYPADLGARCEAWDADVHADCKGSNPAPWCADKWCYVDPCKCDISTIPKISAYLPDAKYQGKPVYYSYATCGSKDQWTEGHHKEACVNQKTEADCTGLSKCAWSEEGKCAGKQLVQHCDMPLKDFEWGEKECRCIGIDGQGGTTKVKIGDGKYMDYPADVGATCDAWDLNRHPECKGDNKPAWCVDRWCFVDPCSCDSPNDVPPKGSFYLPEANFQGKPIFYSYATCGASDNFMSKEEQAKALEKQQAVCSSAWVATPFVGLLLAFISV